MVTWHALLCALAILAGIATAVLGGLQAFAASMSDAPSGDAGKNGAITAMVGFGLIVAGVVGVLL